MELKKVINLKGQIEIITGLHIGGSSDVVEIGGMDNPVIKNPITNEPYIPGSSLKGKMRMLLEWYLNRVQGNGRVCECSNKDCPVCRIFGVSCDKSNAIGPTRIVVRDASLDKEWKDRMDKQNFLITESKTENNIDRITAKATPRSIERVPAGTLFNFEIAYKVLDIGDSVDDEEYFNFILYCMKFLEMDYLGGGGSRGNGKIKFLNISKSDSLSKGEEIIELPGIEVIKEKSAKYKNN